MAAKEYPGIKKPREIRRRMIFFIAVSGVVVNRNRLNISYMLSKNGANGAGLKTVLGFRCEVFGL